MKTWTIGVSNPEWDIPTVFGTFSTFSEAMDKLLRAALNNTRLAEMEQRHEVLNSYHVLIADICDVVDDQGIMDDPDQWEDLEFDGPNETIWYVTED